LQSKLTLLLLLFNLACHSQTKNRLENLFPSNTGEIVIHNDYTLSYIKNCQQPEWVIYKLTDDMLSKKKSCKRPNYFKKDVLILDQEATHDDYTNSGYDRGHLVPAFDMKYNCMSYNETYITSNISPQKHKFNSQIWYGLEKKVRDWVNNKNELYIITGPVISKKNKKIENTNICIPSHFYKIIIDLKDTNIISFLLPHDEESKNIKNHIVSIDSLELITNINFFYKIDSTLENLESKINTEYWFK
jgi:endonuclease G